MGTLKVNGSIWSEAPNSGESQIGIVKGADKLYFYNTGNNDCGIYRNDTSGYIIRIIDNVRTFYGNITGDANTLDGYHASSFSFAGHNHTSLSGITSLDFSAHSDDGASIRTTVDSSTTYFDFNLLDDGGSDMYRWNFGRWDSATSSQINSTLMTLTTESTTSGNAHLRVNGQITASSFNGTATYAHYLNNVGTASGSSHAEALKTFFNNNKSWLPKNSFSTYYSSAYSNGSMYMGYFLGGYDSTPYGGFYVAHYDTPYYIGISYGNYTQQTILTSHNYSTYALPVSGGTMTGRITLASTGIQTNNIAGYYTDQYGNFFHSRSSTGDHWQFHSYDQSMSLKYYADLGILNAPALATLNYGSGAPGSGTRGYGHAGAIYYQV